MIIITKPMHHRQFLIIILIFFCHSLYGQISISSYLGVSKSGASIRFLKNTDIEKKKYQNDLYGSIVSPILGLQLQSKINKFILFNIDIQFTLKGQSLENENFNYDHRFAFIDFMPSIGFKLSKYVQLGIGPYAGKQISDMTGTIPANVIIHGILSRNEDYGINSFISLKLNRFIFRISFQYGFYDIFITAPTNPRFHNRSFNLSLGYSFWTIK